MSSMSLNIFRFLRFFSQPPYRQSIALECVTVTPTSLKLEPHVLTYISDVKH
jgi:hypothetical protein